MIKRERTTIHSSNMYGLSNQHGSSLIEAAIATTIVCVVGLGVLELALVSGTVTRQAVLNESIEDRLNEVRQVLYSEEGCQATLEASIPGGDLRSVAEFSLASVVARDENVATKRRAIASVDEFIGEDWTKEDGSVGYKLTDIKVSKESALSDDEYLLNVALTFDRGPAAVGSRIIVRNLPLQVRVYASNGKIAACTNTEEAKASCLTRGFTWNPDLKRCLIPDVNTFGVQCPAGQTLVGVSAAGVAQCSPSFGLPDPTATGCRPLGAVLTHGQTCCSGCSVYMCDGSPLCSLPSSCTTAPPPLPPPLPPPAVPPPPTCQALGAMLETGCTAGGYAPDNDQANPQCCSGWARWHAYADGACGTGYGYELTCVAAPVTPPACAVDADCSSIGPVSCDGFSVCEGSDLVHKNSQCTFAGSCIGGNCLQGGLTNKTPPAEQSRDTNWAGCAPPPPPPPPTCTGSNLGGACGAFSSSCCQGTCQLNPGETGPCFNGSNCSCQ